MYAFTRNCNQYLNLVLCLLAFMLIQMHSASFSLVPFRKQAVPVHRCSTVFGWTGQCRHIGQCAPLLQLTRKQLKTLACGSRGLITSGLFCCPVDQTWMQSISTDRNQLVMTFGADAGAGAGVGTGTVVAEKSSASAVDMVNLIAPKHHSKVPVASSPVVAGVLKTGTKYLPKMRVKPYKPTKLLNKPPANQSAYQSANQSPNQSYTTSAQHAKRNQSVIVVDPNTGSHSGNVSSPVIRVNDTNKVIPLNGYYVQAPEQQTVWNKHTLISGGGDAGADDHLVEHIVDTNRKTVHYKLPKNCGLAGRDKKIVGGSETVASQWPWMGAIFVIKSDLKKEFWCGATLISERHLITAAHCLSDRKGHRFSPEQLVVMLGSNQLTQMERGEWWAGDKTADKAPKSGSRSEFRVAQCLQHPKFERNSFINDVGLIELADKVPFGEHMRSICLPEQTSWTVQSADQQLEGRLATVLGWGSTYYGGAGTNTLRQVSFPIWTNGQCDRKYSQHIGRGFICAGYLYGGKDACQGDSGSPLMIPNQQQVWSLIGIVSFGNKCAQPGYPGVYTRVAEYLDWIQSNL